jgi:hypothetical protein
MQQEPPMEMELDVAKLMAEASAAIYTTDSTCHAAGMTLSKLFDFYGMASAFVHEVDGGVVLAFRGSVHPFDFSSPAHFWNIIRDWSSNLNFGLIRHKDWPGRVCRGFAHCLEHQSKIIEIHKYLIERNASERGVWLTGHSLGGALAILAGWWLWARGIRVHGVYTFGAPRVGNSCFAQLYHPPLYRFENKHDIVPWAPFGVPILQGYADFLYALRESSLADRFPNYHHAGDLYYLAAGLIDGPHHYYLSRKFNQFARTLYRIKDKSLIGIEDHAISEYARIIDENSELYKWYSWTGLSFSDIAVPMFFADKFGL